MRSESSRLEDQVAYLQKLLDVRDEDAEPVSGGDANFSFNSSLNTTVDSLNTTVNASLDAAELSLGDTPARGTDAAGSAGKGRGFKSADWAVKQENDRVIAISTEMIEIHSEI